MHRHVSVNTSLLGPEEAPMPCQPWPIWPRRERKLPSFTQNGDTLLKAKEMRGFWMFFHVPGFASRCVNSMALWINPLPGEDVCVSVQVPGQQAQVFQLLQAPVVFGPDPTPDPTLGQRTRGQRSVIGGGRLGGVADAVSDPEHAALQQPPGGRWPHGPELGGHVAHGTTGCFCKSPQVPSSKSFPSPSISRRCWVSSWFRFAGSPRKQHK